MTMLKSTDPVKKYLIVNADDYGYYPCVSKGIISGARAGVVTATSVMANRPEIEKQLSWLADVDTIDIGVHLNSTYGKPLTYRMRNRMQHNAQMFQGKYWWAYNSLLDKTLLEDIKDEWRAQIIKCMDFGVCVDFLNSHEHVHMLPGLYGIIRDLADEFGIRNVRYSMPDWFYSRSTSGVMRNALMQVLCLIHSPTRLPTPQPRMFGLSASGRLDQAYLEALVRQLKPGDVAELMCHPGNYDRLEVSDPGLLTYHDWEKEMATLSGEKFKHLRDRENVELIGYRRFVSMATVPKSSVKR